MKKTCAKMASPSFPFPPTVNHQSPHLAPSRKYNCSATCEINSITFCSSYSSRINLNRSFPSKRNFWSGGCRASTSPSEPPPEKEPLPDSGAATTKDSLQIFFAVLFWMSLFFWSCAWDGGNSGKPNKGSRFRK